MIPKGLGCASFVRNTYANPANGSLGHSLPKTTGSIVGAMGLKRCKLDFGAARMFAVLQLGNSPVLALRRLIVTPLHILAGMFALRMQMAD